MVGSGSEEDRLRAEVASLGLESRVVFAGYFPSHLDIIPYYLASTAMWFPSNARSEAFGLVQIEAMACARPVINTAIPHSGVTWVCQNEKTGLTIPINDPEALAAAANRLLNEPGLSERLGIAGRARTIADFDHRLMASRSAEIYARVLA
jgi:glycosyltransferase involved in cell wall biosynthesis